MSRIVKPGLSYTLWGRIVMTKSCRRQAVLPNINIFHLIRKGLECWLGFRGRWDEISGETMNADDMIIFRDKIFCTQWRGAQVEVLASIVSTLVGKGGLSTRSIWHFSHRAHEEITYCVKCVQKRPFWHKCDVLTDSRWPCVEWTMSKNSPFLTSEKLTG